MHLTDTTRRRWVKQFIFGSMATLAAPKWIGTVLAEVTPTGPGPGVIRLKAANIIVQELARNSNGQILRDPNGNAIFVAVAPLTNPGGSVQLTFLQGVAPLTLNRVTADRFVALDSVCTHAGCTVGRFIVANNRMQCPCHGSRYDIEGRVFRDANGISTEPAPDDINRFATCYDEASGVVAVTVPELALHIDSISVHQRDANGRIRLELVFPVTFGGNYEISYQSDLASPPQIIPFATTPSGSANQNIISPSLTGSFTAYVDASGPRGFFSVGLKLRPI